MSKMVAGGSSILTKVSDKNVDPLLADQLKNRIRQLEKEKLADAKEVQVRWLKVREKLAASLAEDDLSFLTLLSEGWVDHTKKIKSLQALHRTSQRKAEAMSELAKKVAEENKKLKKYREEMKVQVDKGLSDVKAKISLYEEENSNIVGDNNNLRAALKKAMEYNTKRTEHINLLQNTNDFLREKHDEMDKKYSDICNEYSQRLEDLGKEHSLLKKKHQERCVENLHLKEAIQLLNQKHSQDKETREMVAEFEGKYKKLIEDSNECVTKYKEQCDKLAKQNHSLKVAREQGRVKLDKVKAENKGMKKTSHKLNKKVNTLSNLCRDLQAKNRDLQAKIEDSSIRLPEETTI